LVEVVSGMSWRKAVEQRIFAPLGMTHAFARPTESLRFRAAVGHLVSADGSFPRASVVSVTYLPASMAPTGSVLTMSASDLVTFGMAHLNSGIGGKGTRWMSEQSARLMRNGEVELPASCLMWEREWGLGWALSECNGVKLFGHSGGSAGQQAFLGILPEHDAVFAIQLNGMSPTGSTTVLQRVTQDMLYDIAGVRVEAPKPIAQPREVARFTGRYGTAGFRFEVSLNRGGLLVRMEVEGYDDLPPASFELQPIASNRFRTVASDGTLVYDCIFLDPDAEGRPQSLFYGFRLHRRVTSASA
jgi:CubicO group peptidase (beta-lactamase class C family)